MFRPTKVQIDTRSLRHNLTLLRSWAGEANFFCPMVKANAYGHGDLIVAREVEKAGCSAVGVALIEEGVRLRDAGICLPILVFAPFDDEGARAMIERRLTPVITRFEDLDALEKAKTTPALAAHLKFNTGMQRLGFEAGELPRLHSRLRELPFVRVEGVCTHLTHGEEILESGGFSSRQVERFAVMAREFPGVRHFHKSASLAALRERAGHMGAGARPGIGIYGLPHEGRAAGAGLKPVLTWTTRLARVHCVGPGDPVGYSARFAAERRSTIGVFPVGYADGYVRGLSNKGELLFRGRRVPVVGGVCMDYIFADLTDALDEGAAQPGEPAVLLGRQGGLEISAADIAEKLGTIAYEVVTAISRRVPRETL